MALYITGDIHGEPSRFDHKYLKEQYDLLPLLAEDTIIICSEFGLP
ncbi:MAG: hypothetical protein WCR27_10140 [Eubacteriales bacterium]